MFALIIAASLQSFGSNYTADHDAWLRSVVECEPVAQCASLLDPFGDADFVHAAYGDYEAHIIRAALYRHGEAGLALAFDRARDDWPTSAVMETVLKGWPGLDFTRVTAEGFNFLPDAALRPDLERLAPSLGDLRPDDQARVSIRLGVSGGAARLDSIQPWRFGRDTALTIGRTAHFDLANNGFHGDLIILMEQWTRILADPDQPLDRRREVLAGVAAFPEALYPFLHRLSDLDPALQEGELGEALRAARLRAGDPRLATEQARDCRTVASRLEGLADSGDLDLWFQIRRDRLELQMCLNALAFTGRFAADAADIIAPLLDSSDLEVRVMALQTLGALGNRSALNAARTALESPHWLEVLAALEAIEGLGDESDREPIAEVAAGHWHWLIREAADALLVRASWAVFRDRTVFGLNPMVLDRATFLDPGESLSMRVSANGFSPFERLPAITCRSEQFRWAGEIVTPERRPEYDRPSNAGWDEPNRIAVPGGAFAFTDLGEWGGELIFQPTEGQPMALIDDNIHDVIQVRPEVYIVTTGLAHLGISEGGFHRVEREGDAWRVSLIDRAISPPDWAVRLPGGLVGARTGEGFYVMNTEQVVGMADCVPGEPWVFERR